MKETPSPDPENKGGRNQQGLELQQRDTRDGGAAPERELSCFFSQLHAWRCPNTCPMPSYQNTDAPLVASQYHRLYLPR
ncbi:hypothetical protein KUCAC02_023884 [Chaenocephalus aceratus]|uniref:Uncharacterized protein n=1 Tax=Chaenocephalus aceratus TaxID=36190 RepID=A0ACB9WGI5_CHAAC|nr:hypothetical protein KUCAC02_023884 [Chaenocephalus aceratus]